MSIDGPNKSKRGRPRVDSEPVKLRLEREVLNAIDAFVAQHAFITNRQSALRIIVEAWLMDYGFLAKNPETREEAIARDQIYNLEDEGDALRARAPGLKKRVAAARKVSGELKAIGLLSPDNLSFSTPFASPIQIKDGRMIGTLADAREVFRSLPDVGSHRARWSAALLLLLKAAANKKFMPEAESLLIEALKAEGLI